MSTAVEVREKAVSQMEKWARDDVYGYDQQYRWGERGDFDCSSAVISAYEYAGVPVKSFGATYTGNMYDVFLRCDFKDVTSEVNLSTSQGMLRGDILLNKRDHTAMYCGGCQIVEASINESGRTTGGRPGDQTGREFRITSYRNYPWDCVLRYVGAEKTGLPSTPVAESTPTIKVEIPFGMVKLGSKGPFVAAVQGALKYHKLDPKWIDGEAGAKTIAMIKEFQQMHGLTPDGIAGKDTLTKLFE